MIHEVLRAFRAEGRDLIPGQFVETSHWRLEQQLIRQRKLGIPRVPQAEYDKLVPINVNKEEETVVVIPKETSSSTVEKKASAPKSLEPMAISKGGVEKSKGRSGNLRKKVVPKRIPPRKS
jgi:hypothetical protein